MLSIVKSMSLIGLDGYLINVEVDVSPGMPCFEIVGLPDTSVKESKERVKTAIKNSNLDLLIRRSGTYQHTGQGAGIGTAPPYA